MIGERTPCCTVGSQRTKAAGDILIDSMLFRLSVTIAMMRGTRKLMTTGRANIVKQLRNDRNEITLQGTASPHNPFGTDVVRARPETGA